MIHARFMKVSFRRIKWNSVVFYGGVFFEKSDRKTSLFPRRRENKIQDMFPPDFRKFVRAEGSNIAHIKEIHGSIMAHELCMTHLVVLFENYQV